MAITRRLPGLWISQSGASDETGEFAAATLVGLHHAVGVVASLGQFAIALDQRWELGF